MAKHISNEEIVGQFMATKAVDFNAIGKVVAELGPALSISTGPISHRLVIVGQPFIVACFMPLADLGSLVGGISGRTPNVGGTVTGQ